MNFFKYIFLLLILAFKLAYPQNYSKILMVTEIVNDIRTTGSTLAIGRNSFLYTHRLFFFSNNYVYSDIYSAGKADETCTILKSRELENFLLSCAGENFNFKKEGNKYTTMIGDYFPKKLVLKEIYSLLPSFDCKKKTNFAEEKICSDMLLSGLDLSLKEAYDYAKKYASEQHSDYNLKSIIKKQKTFLSERNRCQSKACLQDIVYEQLIFLDDISPVITLY